MSKVLLVSPCTSLEVRTARTAAFARLVAQLRAHVQVHWISGIVHDPARLPPDVQGVDLRGARRRGGWLRLWRAVRASRGAVAPDVVVTSGLGLPPVGVPCVAIAHDPEGSGWEPASGGLWLRVAGRSPQTVVVPTDAVGDAVARLGVARARIHRLRIGHPVPDAPAPFPPRGAILQLIHPGRIHPVEGQHLSIDAVSRLPVVQRRRVHLTIAGPVADRGYLAQLRIAAARQPITVQADPPDLRDPIGSAHLALCPRLAGDVPAAAVQAMALGRAAVCVGAGLARADVPSVQAAIRAALHDPALEVRGRDAHDQAVREHGWRAWWPRWRALLREVAQR